ncbi:MAG: hypothetical protein JWS11_2853 [Cypionkella sp.]|nr:hypothetical protein [Cypionkella sp.]
MAPSRGHTAALPVNDCCRLVLWSAGIAKGDVVEGCIAGTS